MGDIYFFSKIETYAELSNFWPSPIELNGLLWQTVEHYYQAQKLVDVSEQEVIRNAQSPGSAKRNAYKMAWRIDWEEVKEEVMLKALRAKFGQHEDLAEILIGTGDGRLHENSPKDMYWGVQGKDRLGKLLEQVRDEIRTSKRRRSRSPYPAENAS
jgi:ribA/ribD-fused uncharacterized protein